MGRSGGFHRARRRGERGAVRAPPARDRGERHQAGEQDPHAHPAQGRQPFVQDEDGDDRGDEKCAAGLLDASADVRNDVLYFLIAGIVSGQNA